MPSTGPELRLAAADLTRRVEPGAIDATMATLTVAGARVGTTQLDIKVDMVRPLQSARTSLAASRSSLVVASGLDRGRKFLASCPKDGCSRAPSQVPGSGRQPQRSMIRASCPQSAMKVSRASGEIAVVAVLVSG